MMTQTLACHQIAAAGVVAGVQQLADHQIASLGVVSGVQQVAEHQVGEGCLGVTCDPYWDNVVLAMHMADFTDETGQTITVVGDAHINGSGKFGTSAHFDGTDYLYTESSTYFNIPGDFTVEGFIYQPDENLDRCIFDNRSGGNGIGIYSSSIFLGGALENKLCVANNSTIISGVHSTTFNINEWNHFAVCRSGTSLKGYVNGVSVFTVTDARTYTADTRIFIGSSYIATQNFSGDMCDILVTKVAKYTANFTPPTAPFADTAC